MGNGAPNVNRYQEAIRIEDVVACCLARAWTPQCRGRTLKNMSSLEQLQKLIGDDLHELHLLYRRRWFAWPMDRVVKEEHLGRCCYLAEEFLNAVDLRTLKATVGLSDEEWRKFKLKISG